ncbi:MAG: hypothetical protein DHS20C02_01000 [Micavibrio sp.]|nr:MAG: hypothetical protein DHS20C02_01000 [Micavibrio sp.]
MATYNLSQDFALLSNPGKLNASVKNKPVEVLDLLANYRATLYDQPKGQKLKNNHQKLDQACQIVGDYIFDHLPDHAEANIKFSHILNSVDRSPGALHFARCAQKVQPDNSAIASEIVLTLLTLYNARKHRDYANEALYEAKQACKTCPDHQTFYALGEAYKALGDYAEAGNAYLESTKFKPNALAYKELAYLARSHKKDYEEALAHAEKAHELDPEDLKIQEELGIVLCERRNHERAAPLLKAVHEKNVISRYGLLHLFESLTETGQFKEAEPLINQIYDKCQDKSISFSKALDMYGKWIAADKNSVHLENAMTVANRAEQIFPNNMRTRNQLARFYYAAEDYEMAMNSIEIVLAEKNPEKFSLLMLAEHCCTKLGENEKAERIIQDALKAHPSNKHVLVAAGYRALHNKDTSKALEYADKALGLYPDFISAKKLQTIAIGETKNINKRHQNQPIP